jgi:hypothetical protein
MHSFATWRKSWSDSTSDLLTWLSSRALPQMTYIGRGSNSLLASMKHCFAIRQWSNIRPKKSTTDTKTYWRTEALVTRWSELSSSCLDRSVPCRTDPETGRPQDLPRGNSKKKQPCPYRRSRLGRPVNESWYPLQRSLDGFQKRSESKLFWDRALPIPLFIQLP